jgi:uncharacterized membrane protein
MSKTALIQRLNKTYKMERSHAFITFPAIAIYLLFTRSPLDILFLLYGLILCIFILFQGQHYFKIKLQRLKGNSIDQHKNLLFFRKSKKANIILIGSIPIVFLNQLYVSNWTITADNLLIWSVFANVFGILEHINYYNRQLMIDNSPDLNYVVKNRKLKIASLAKDLKENRL